MIVASLQGTKYAVAYNVPRLIPRPLRGLNVPEGTGVYITRNTAGLIQTVCTLVVACAKTQKQERREARAESISNGSCV